ncbi:MAG: hypothetical protein HN657_00640 [Candidatus Marinimicrobia bacterium]|jgi:uncharacterized protein YdiU (UPF0061 family)|nr:hypothetical protein [Candidatus Neomarinimicrobiota bacterium]MBT3496473.1 hypothetical protein [Candidatus Neomarinimicrobiota bacterium]MBT3692170.1 hypothetical protein [Candidatus Neomarinimicrobiota bacterium]MBT3732647.1 hypothetical protein [Candidatus Neomarinimicrobiota bacterium]MBT4144465.1 hypothetical protein [Candidatus Neomarinimicrobiota bacterium]
MPKGKEVQNEAVEKIDVQKEMLASKFGALMDKVGDGYGEPLQTELINRLEQTIADFHEEVTEMIDTLKENSSRRHERLKEIWNQKEDEAPVQIDQDQDESSEDNSEPKEMSAWEKRLETMEHGDEDTKEEKSSSEKPKEKEKKKKKGLFGRKKK